MQSRRILALVALLVAAVAASPAAALPPVDDNEQLRSSVTDVRVLNLVNSLYLTPEQTQALLPLIHDNAQEIEALRAERQRIAPQFQAAVETLRLELLANNGVSEEAKRAVREAEGEFKRLLHDHERNQADRVERVKGILTQNQMVLVAEFIPCLVPVRSLTNPERIGQASDHSGTQRLLEMARKMPEPRYRRMRDHPPQRLTEGLSRYVSKEEMPAKMAEIQRTLDEARAMSEADFELHRAELAQRIGPPPRPAARGKQLDGRIAGYLLNPNLAPILTQRLAAAPRG